MATDLQAALEQLTAIPDTDYPLLSVYVDWSVDGNGQRPAVKMVDQALNDIESEWNLHGEEREQLSSDHVRIMEYLNREAPSEAQGLAIFACAAENVWQAIPLQVPVETSVVAGRFPHMFHLARVIDDFETYALVIAEGQEARILVIAHNEAEFAGHTEASEKIKRFDQGGQAQMLFQRRTGNIIKAHIKDLSAELTKVMDRYNVNHIIFSSNDSIKGIVNDTLPDQIKAKMIDYITLEPRSDMKTIMDTISPLMEQTERAQEQEILEDLENQVGSNARGVVGIAETAMALSKGQVRMLVMTKDFQAMGRYNPTSGFLYEANREKDPYDGTTLEEVELREAFTNRAMQISAEVQIVDSSEYLDQNGKVGALLHYRDDIQAIEAGSR